MLFLLLTLSFMMGSLLAGGVAMFIMFKLMASPKVMKWYLNWIKDIMEKYEKEFEELV